MDYIRLGSARHNDRPGASISITVVLAVVIGLGAGLATLAPYRRDYQAVHA
jgi:hypothetical protein